jgi:cation diffusion facilitator family transporter
MSHPKSHSHDHERGHEHSPDHAHAHGHSHGTGVLGWFATVFHWHGHADDAGLTASDPALATEEGIRTVWLALAALSMTTLMQIVVVALSGSVALFADTAHNLGDTLNSIPLLIAFYLARRAATRRYTYGYGKAEDIAGIFIVLSIAVSAAIIFWESFQKLLNPQPMQNLPWVAAAAVIGFLGNEAVALLQIRTGKRIGSEAMMADGLHARTDGLTSLAVLIAVGGSLIGLPILDPLIGLLIGVAILFITRDAALRIWYRLMDAVDPKIIDEIEHATGHVDGVQRIERAQARWVGHRLQAEVVIVVDEDLSVRESHAVADAVEHELHAHLPHLATVTVHLHPCRHGSSLAPIAG